jgi:hypothetical protein
MPQIITVAEDKVFRRIHTGFVIGNFIHLDIDHSTLRVLYAAVSNNLNCNDIL